MQPALASPVPAAPAKAKNARPSPFPSIKLQMFGAIFMQRLGMNLNIGGQLFPFPLSLAITPAVIGWNLAVGNAVLPMQRLVPYILFVAAMALSALVNHGGMSLMSLFLVAGIYAMFLCPIALDEPGYMRFFRMIANVSSIICLLGAAQYVVQFLWSPAWLFSWRTIVPANFLIEFNTLNEINYGSQIYKANGFFLMEASYQSQMAARALLISIFILRDFRYLVPLGIGLLTAYSGTGIVLFGIFGALPLLIAMMRDRRFSMIFPILVLLAPVAVILLWSRLNLDLFVDRLGEINDERSSAYARFVTGQIMLRIFSASDFVTLAFGAGPGAGASFQAQVQSGGDTFASTWIKLLLEYGLCGFLAFMVFFFTCMRHTLRSAWLAAAFTFHFFVLDGGFAVPQQAFLSLFLGAFVCLRRSGDPQSPTWPAFGRQPMRPPSSSATGSPSRPPG